ncbi:hypothetical protein AB4144_13690 [Rhizobiaceae sp. 2RAB30]
MRFVPGPGLHHGGDGLVASPQVLSLVVAFLCFLIVGGFLLFLVPEPRAGVSTSADAGLADTGDAAEPDLPASAPNRSGPTGLNAQRRLPLGGLGQPRMAPTTRLPVEGADGTHFIDVGQVRSIRADAHYTFVHDGNRERMCLWAISQAEAQLDPSAASPPGRAPGVAGAAALPSWSSISFRAPSSPLARALRP